MLFNHFIFRLSLRVILLTLLIIAAIYTFQQPEMKLTSFIVAGLAVFSMSEMIRFVTQTNRKLTRFLESVKYSDFLSGFTADNRLGQSFKGLNTAFNEVLDAFRKARSEKEEHWLYLNTVIQHVSTGLISFDATGKIELINTIAKRFLQAPQIRNINELQHYDEFYKILKTIPAGGKEMCRINDRTNLAIHATSLRIKGENLKLVALQNIQTELQQKEIESWQNLTRVLRHEIMNSMTPIASLTSTLNDILTEELEDKGEHFEISVEGVDDIHDGLKTIESRSQSLINFIDAYREYTTIPTPQKTTFVVKDLIDEVEALLKVELRKNKIEFVRETYPANLQIDADIELIEQVLINLVKNAIEAVQKAKGGKIEVKAGHDAKGSAFISVQDNGDGIVPEALERIFIPFYTTKRTGSGIGLALSRQIMQMHQGSLSVDSKLQHYTIFTMRF